MTRSAIILNYHKIISDVDSQNGPTPSPFSVKQSDFINQIELIQRNDIPIISLSDWRRGNTNSPLSVILTFDDGFNSDYEFVFKKLVQERITASFFPVVSTINTDGKINWEQLKEMAEKGYAIGSHGVSHKSLLQLSEEDCILELSKSMQTIQQNINQKVELFSFPWGMYNAELINKLKKIGYKYALTSRVKTNTCSSAFILHRINIKASTSIKEFERLIALKTRLPIKMRIISNLSYFVNRYLGVSRVNSITKYT